VSTRIGSVLPAEIQAEFDGRELGSKSSCGYFAVTVDADGSPRPCMLSVGEILVVDEHTIRLAVWPDSSTAANLRRGGRVVLCYVRPNTVLYVSGHTVRTWDDKLLAAEISVDGVAADDHPGFAVIDGIRFCYEGSPEELTAAWGGQLAALRKGSP
jgi:hypothetical protein